MILVPTTSLIESLTILSELGLLLIFTEIYICIFSGSRYLQKKLNCFFAIIIFFLNCPRVEDALF